MDCRWFKEKFQRAGIVSALGSPQKIVHFVIQIGMNALVSRLNPLCVIFV